MSSPGGSGPRSAERDTRPDPNDASVTASLPAVSDSSSDFGGSGSGSGSDAGASPYPHGSMPGTSSRDPWSESSAPLRKDAGKPASGPNGRTEVVPNVAPVPAAAGAPAGGQLPFGGKLPPRPGEAAASRAESTSVRRPIRDRAGTKPARRAQLTLRRFNVWSVFKFSCMLAIALWLVWMIVIGVLYGILDASGVVKSINDVYAQIQGADAKAIVRPGQVLGIAAIVGVVNIVLFIALSSLFAVIYNLVSDFVGGVEVTLSERE